MTENIFWLGHSSIRINGEKIIYIDPWKIRGEQKADLVLISHSHDDHLSPADVRKVQTPDTVIITTGDCAGRLSGTVRVITPGETITVGTVSVEAVPSYNPSKPFHPKHNNWVGFIITMDGTRIYYCGDTDHIPEMDAIQADIIIAPVGGTYTMTAEEAARMVNIIGPKAAIPIHYGDIVGSIEDAERFRELCDCPVDIKPVTQG